MEKRIELEKRGRPADQITDLILDNCRSTSIVGLSDEFKALETLSLINVGLTTLKGFPCLPNLKKLELSDNRISNGLNYLTTSPKLTYLNLSGNKIKDLDTLKPLESFQTLEVLDLFNNEATTSENYREKIFAMLPSLKYLDGFDMNEVEASSEGGNSDEENTNAFCINGLEIDLDELDKFENYLKEKKPNAFSKETSNDEDDLDILLKQIKLEENSESERKHLNHSEQSIKMHVEYASNANANTNSSKNADNTNDDKNRPTSSIALLMCTFMSILSLGSYAIYEDEYDDGEDEDDDDDSDEDNDVSLGEVYNDDLEDDNSDWDEENEGEDDEDEASDEEEGDEAGGNEKNADTPEESQARGKKRKHEDDENEKDG